MENIQNCKLGLPFFNELPQGWVIASLIDFYDEQNNLLEGKAFLVKSMITENCYWANRVKENFPYIYTDFHRFLEADHVFILNN